MRNESSQQGKTLKKWYTESQYVDIETGEIITKQQYENEYYKVKTNRKIEITDNYGIIKYITECRARNQTRLFN